MIRLFRVSLPLSVLALIISEALLAFGCYAAAYGMVSDLGLEFFLLFEGGAERTAAVVATILLGAYFNDLDSEIRVISRLRLVQQYCLVIGLAFLAQALLGYIQPELILERWHMMLGSALALVLLPAWRMLFDMLVLRVISRERILFVGCSRLVQELGDEMQAKPHLAMVSAGYLAEAPAEGRHAGIGEWIGPLSQLPEAFASLKPDLIVVGLDERRGRMPVDALLSLRLGGAAIEYASELYERVMWRVPLESLRPSYLIFSRDVGPTRMSLLQQRVVSLLVSGAGILLTLPLMILVWLAVRLSSPGGALYRQRRVGLNGKVFEVLKFRSMYIDAEARSGAVWAQQNDPRITPVGRWLRKLRLDELPQFFNVVKGDMALVGPRPERPEFVRVLTEQIPFYGQRHTVLPGITGWAQINHKYGDTVEDTVKKLEYDLFYLKNLGASLDFYIIFHTLKVMLLSRGAQ
jgi:sugar transferase (PEP-CTERM system associated)